MSDSHEFDRLIFGEPLTPEQLARRANDIALTDRVKAGYTLPKGDKPVIIEGHLDQDAVSAMEEIWQGNRNGVVKIAKRVAAKINIKNLPAIELDDLINEGYFGLMHAAINWTPELTSFFFSFGNGYASNYIERLAKKTRSNVRVPLAKRDAINNLERVQWANYSKRETILSRRGLAELLGISLDEVEDLQTIAARTDQIGSLDRGFFDDDRVAKSTFSDGNGEFKPVDPKVEVNLSPEEQVIARDVNRIIAMYPHGEDLGLDQTDLRILHLRFHHEKPRSFESIGKSLSMSRDVASLRYHRALAILRHPLASHSIVDLLQD